MFKRRFTKVLPTIVPVFNDPTKDAEMLTANKSGESFASIAKRFGVSAKTVSRRVKLAKEKEIVIPEIKKTKFTIIDVDQIISLYDSGKRVSEIAKIVDCSHHTVYRHLKNNDRKLLAKPELGEYISYDSVVQEFKNGKSPPQIAKEMNVSYSYITQIIRKKYMSLRELRNKEYEDRNKKMYEDYITKRPFKEIIETYELCPTTVFLYLKKQHGGTYPIV